MGGDGGGSGVIAGLRGACAVVNAEDVGCGEVGAFLGEIIILAVGAGNAAGGSLHGQDQESGGGGILHTAVFFHIVQQPFHRLLAAQIGVQDHGGGNVCRLSSPGMPKKTLRMYCNGHRII